MSASALPPKGFVAAGKVLRAERSRHPAFSTAAYPMALAAPRHQRGLHYQQVVEHALAAWANQREGVTIEFGPWFRFLNADLEAGGWWRWCQPDVLLTSATGPPLVLEIKLTLEPRAWWQVVELYAPVVSVALGRPVYGGIICKSADVRAVRPRINGDLTLSVEPALWLDAVMLLTLAQTWPLRYRLPVLQWKRPSIDSANSESTARITSASS